MSPWKTTGSATSRSTPPAPSSFSTTATLFISRTSTSARSRGGVNTKTRRHEGVDGDRRADSTSPVCCPRRLIGDEPRDENPACARASCSCPVQPCSSPVHALIHVLFPLLITRLLWLRHAREVH